jgi:hypothetical protein
MRPDMKPKVLAGSVTAHNEISFTINGPIDFTGELLYLLGKSKTGQKSLCQYCKEPITLYRNL